MNQKERMIELEQEMYNLQNQLDDIKGIIKANEAILDNLSFDDLSIDEMELQNTWDSCEFEIETLKDGLELFLANVKNTIFGN